MPPFDPPGSAEASDSAEGQVYPMAPAIRGTLILLYLALVLPLPAVAPPGLRPVAWVALPLGLLLVLAATAEQVRLDEWGITVGPAPWCARVWRRGWSVPWSRVRGLTPVATSQGGRVFYLRTAPAERSAGAAGAGPAQPGRSYLLPQRVEHFEDFLSRFAAATGLDVSGIGRISPPWTYQLLAWLSGLLLAAEVLTLGITLRG